MSSGGGTAGAATATGAATTTPGATTTTATVATTVVPAGQSGSGTSSGGGGVSTAALVIAVVAAALVAALLGYLLGRRRTTGGSTPITSRPIVPPKPVAPSATPAPPAGAHDRTQLIDALVDIRDRVGLGGLSELIGNRLATIGVATIDPVGDEFAADRHWAQGADRLTHDPSLDGTVASTVSYGYTDHGAPYRLPGVIVWRLERSV